MSHVFHLRRWKRARGALSDDSGSATVEACLWFPLYFFLFVMIADAAAIFMNQSLIQRMIQDGNRGMAVGVIDTTADLETWVETALATTAPNATATSTLNGSIVTTRVTVPAGDLDLSGVSGFFTNLQVNIVAHHRLEV